MKNTLLMLCLACAMQANPTTPEVAPTLRAQADQAVRAYFGGQPHGTAEVVTAIHRRAAVAPDDTDVDRAVRSIVYISDELAPIETVELLESLLTRAPAALKDFAAARLRLLAARRAPLEARFTTLSGEVVDLAALRGKVVLVDVWATWCSPCLAELPNVKQVYEAYHAAGFEVIGVCLENANLKPDDTPEQTAAKHTAARKKLNDFTSEWKLPWPQHYDGKYWNNEISRGRFNIHAVPATFLLGKDGVIAVVNVRGPQLETEVRRLLNL